MYFSRIKQISLYKNKLVFGDKAIPLNDDFSFYLNWRKPALLTEKDKAMGIDIIPKI
jgi:hypothetical protein